MRFGNEKTNNVWEVFNWNVKKRIVKNIRPYIELSTTSILKRNTKESMNKKTIENNNSNSHQLTVHLHMTNRLDCVIRVCPSVQQAVRLIYTHTHGILWFTAFVKGFSILNYKSIPVNNAFFDIRRCNLLVCEKRGTKDWLFRLKV